MSIKRQRYSIGGTPVGVTGDETIRRAPCFTNEEEDAVGLRAKDRWTAEDELRKLGVDYSRGPLWEPYVLVDRNLYTGQNPSSAGPLALEFLKQL